MQAVRLDTDSYLMDSSCRTFHNIILKQSFNCTPIMQAAAWEKYSPMPLLSCHLLICQNRENRLGQDAISYNVDLFICKNQLFEFE